MFGNVGQAWFAHVPSRPRPRSICTCLGTRWIFGEFPPFEKYHVSQVSRRGAPQQKGGLHGPREVLMQIVFSMFDLWFSFVRRVGTAFVFLFWVSMRFLSGVGQFATRRLFCKRTPRQTQTCCFDFPWTFVWRSLEEYSYRSRTQIKK